MKKKVLFVIINMNVGGTEKSLVNMLSVMSKEHYDITVLMLEKYGGFLNFIPSWVNVEYFKNYNKIKDMLNKPPQLIALSLFKEGKVIKAFNIAFLHLISKILHARTLFFKYLLKDYPRINKRYDIAIAYAGPMDFITYFILYRIKAKKKIQWIHFDVSKIYFNKTYLSKMYEKFNKIVVVSIAAKDKFISMLPNLEKKTEVFENIVSEELINFQSNHGLGFNDKFNGLRILTVGRLTLEKGQDLIVPVLARLINEGYNVKWYCVGEGGNREKIENLIEKLNVKDRFILLGLDTNPYSYMKQCDIYVQPSRYEACCITLAEARCLNKPIITTNFTGAKEQIRNGETGLIVNIKVDEIYNAVKKLINESNLRKKMSDNLSNENSNKTTQMKKIHSLIN